MALLLGPDGKPIVTPDGAVLESTYQGYGLGTMPLTVDPRDWSALLHPGIAQGVHAGAPQAVADISEGRLGGIYDQDGEGACVAYSESGLVSLDEAVNRRTWIWLDAENFYRRNGGTGQNGVDTRATLEDARANGINRRTGQPPVKIESYLFVPKQVGLFKETIMAALALGKPCTVATLLPQNFGWDSSGAPNPNAYHQVIIVGGDDTWATILNSWGPNWARGGKGRLLWSHLDASRWDVYAYVVTAVGEVPIPNPNPNPNPNPDPQPPVTPIRISGDLTGGGSELVAVGQTLPTVVQGRACTLTVTRVERPDPNPNPNPNPDPNPDPNPTPGDLVVTVGVQHSGYIVATVRDSAGAVVNVICECFMDGASQGQRQVGAGTGWAWAGIWVVGAAAIAHAASITVTARDEAGHSGTGTLK